MNELPLLSVSELTGIIKELIESHFSTVLVEGEISNWRPASSGHIYFTLKDGTSAIQAVMFKGRASRLDFKPADGILVKARGAVSVYTARGQYQIVVDSMEKAGAGDILAMLEERKKRLAAEGLFNSVGKPPLPPFPARVAVITSPTGAALRDILSVLKRRNAGIRITILPAAVQGEEAPAAIVRQLRTANTYCLGDVIILGRGGGSLEDLLAFSDEAVVRAVAASKIPVISAVGHEIDFSLSDYAATLRAATPSAAAELVSNNAADVADSIRAAADTLLLSFRSRMAQYKALVESFSGETLTLRFEKIVQPLRQRFDEALGTLRETAERCLSDAEYRRSSAEGILCAADPSAVLRRGFAIVRHADSLRSVTDAAELTKNQNVSIVFAHGGALASIQEIQHEKI